MSGSCARHVREAKGGAFEVSGSVRLVDIDPAYVTTVYKRSKSLPRRTIQHARLDHLVWKALITPDTGIQIEVPTETVFSSRCITIPITLSLLPLPNYTPGVVVIYSRRGSDLRLLPQEDLKPS